MDREIDKQRLEEWQEMGKKGTPSRLMENSELPQIYLKTEEEMAANSKVSDEVDGKRQQKRIHEFLDEGMSEAQWLKLVDEASLFFSFLVSLFLWLHFFFFFLFSFLRSACRAKMCRNTCARNATGRRRGCKNLNRAFHKRKVLRRRRRSPNHKRKNPLARR